MRTLLIVLSMAAAAAAQDQAVRLQKKIEECSRHITERFVFFGGGSGVLISSDGYALTNFHVAGPTGPAMKCGLSDGRFVDAVLVGLDPGGGEVRRRGQRFLRGFELAEIVAERVRGFL